MQNWVQAIKIFHFGPKFGLNTVILAAMNCNSPVAYIRINIINETIQWNHMISQYFFLMIWVSYHEASIEIPDYMHKSTISKENDNIFQDH